jgi:CBS domain containing-hemolysin-like protein
LFGRQPEAGESISYENIDFTIEAVEGGRINTIRVIKNLAPTEPPSSENGNGNSK